MVHPNRGKRMTTRCDSRILLFPSRERLEAYMETMIYAPKKYDIFTYRLEVAFAVRMKNRHRIAYLCADHMWRIPSCIAGRKMVEP